MHNFALPSHQKAENIGPTASSIDLIFLVHYTSERLKKT